MLSQKIRNLEKPPFCADFNLLWKSAFIIIHSDPLHLLLVLLINLTTPDGVLWGISFCLP